MKRVKKRALEKVKYFSLFEKGLDMEEIIILGGLERLRDAVMYGNLDRNARERTIKIITHLSKDTLKHIKIFKNLMR